MTYRLTLPSRTEVPRDDADGWVPFTPKNLRLLRCEQSDRGASIGIGHHAFRDGPMWYVQVMAATDRTGEARDGLGWYCVVTFGGVGKATRWEASRDMAAIVAADQVDSILKVGRPWS